jgi:hypothetical protein
MRWRWLFLTIVICAAGAIAGFLIWPVSDSGPTATPRPTVSHPSPAKDLAVHGPEPGEQDNIKAATTTLDGLPAEFSQGRTDGLAAGDAATGADMRMAFPPGAQVVVDPATWRRTGAIASVTVAVRTAAGSSRQVAILFDDGAGWKLSETYPVEGR